MKGSFGANYENCMSLMGIVSFVIGFRYRTATFPRYLVAGNYRSMMTFPVCFAPILDHTCYSTDIHEATENKREEDEWLFLADMDRKRSPPLFQEMIRRYLQMIKVASGLAQY